MAERWRTKGGTAEHGAAAQGHVETAGSSGTSDGRGKDGGRGARLRGGGRQFASRRALAELIDMTSRALED